MKASIFINKNIHKEIEITDLKKLKLKDIISQLSEEELNINILCYIDNEDSTIINNKGIMLEKKGKNFNYKISL